jgi:hypothetical protein
VIVLGEKEASSLRPEGNMCSPPVTDDPRGNQRLEGLESSQIPEPKRPNYPENSPDKDLMFPLTSVADLVVKIQQ